MWKRTLTFAGILMVGLLSVGGLSFGDAGIEIVGEAEALPSTCRTMGVGCCDAATTVQDPARCLT